MARIVIGELSHDSKLDEEAMTRVVGGFAGAVATSVARGLLKRELLGSALNGIGVTDPRVQFGIGAIVTVGVLAAGAAPAAVLASVALTAYGGYRLVVPGNDAPSAVKPAIPSFRIRVPGRTRGASGSW